MVVAGKRWICAGVPSESANAHVIQVTCLTLDSCSIQSNFLISVVAPALIIKPTDQNITEGNKVTLQCSASGKPVPEIRWIKDDEVVGEGETLNFDALRNRSGEYWCIADNGLNDTVDASAYLDVQCKYEAAVSLGGSRDRVRETALFHVSWSDRYRLRCVSKL